MFAISGVRKMALWVPESKFRLVGHLIDFDNFSIEILIEVKK